MKKSLLPFLAAGALVCSLGACSSSKTPAPSATSSATATSPGGSSETLATNPGLDENSFPVMAASTEMFMVRSSEIAGPRAVNPAVRIYAKLMRDAHKDNTEELNSLAARKAITLPTTMLPVHQRLMEPMSELNIGEKFDKRYLEAHITAHEQAITLYENAVTNEPDADLRAYAGRVLPRLRDHLVMAKKAKDALN